MLQKPKCPIIALEEHYADDELVATYTGLDVNPVPAIVTRLRDVGEERLKAMDADGIDVQVLSHTAPSTQKLPADVAVQVDGGVDPHTAPRCRAAGANLFVAGSAIFDESDSAAAYRAIADAVGAV